MTDSKAIKYVKGCGRISISNQVAVEEKQSDTLQTLTETDICKKFRNVFFFFLFF